MLHIENEANTTAEKSEVSDENKSVVLVVNTQARRGQEMFAQAKDGLRVAGVNVTAAYPIADCKHLVQQVKSLVKDGVKTLVLGGGDGTISSVVDCLVNKDVTLGILPLGTANDFATTLQIPAEVEQACSVIARGRCAEVDLGIVNGSHYVNVASVGFGAAVAAQTTNDDKKLLGPLAYVIAAAQTASSYSPFTARLTFTNQVIETKAVHIAVANGRLYGGGNLVTPDARIDDNELIVVIFEPMGPLDLYQVGLHLRDGTYVRNPHVRVFRRVRSLKLEIIRGQPQRVNADGELITRTPAEFGIAHRALKVLVP